MTASSPHQPTVRVPRVLTVLQPWAWCITHAGKTVENRSWNSAYRGPIGIHAGRRYDIHGAVAAGRLAGRRLSPARGPWTQRGAVIAIADLVDVHVCDGSCSDWAVPGMHHLVLAHVRPVVPVPIRGALGLWRAPTDLTLTPAG